MRCPICSKEIDMFYCDVIFKQTVTSYRIMKDGVEAIDEDEQETERRDVSARTAMQNLK